MRSLHRGAIASAPRPVACPDRVPRRRSSLGQPTALGAPTKALRGLCSHTGHTRPHEEEQTCSPDVLLAAYTQNGAA